METPHVCKISIATELRPLQSLKTVPLAKTLSQKMIIFQAVVLLLALVASPVAPALLPQDQPEVTMETVKSAFSPP